MKPDSTVSRYLPPANHALRDFALCALIGLVVAVGCYLGFGHIHP